MSMPKRAEKRDLVRSGDEACLARQMVRPSFSALPTCRMPPHRPNSAAPGGTEWAKKRNAPVDDPDFKLALLPRPILLRKTGLRRVTQSVTQSGRFKTNVSDINKAAQGRTRLRLRWLRAWRISCGHQSSHISYVHSSDGPDTMSAFRLPPRGGLLPAVDCGHFTLPITDDAPSSSWANVSAFRFIRTNQGFARHFGPKPSGLVRSTYKGPISDA